MRVKTGPLEAFSLDGVGGLTRWIEMRRTMVRGELRDCGEGRYRGRESCGGFDKGPVGAGQARRESVPRCGSDVLVCMHPT